MFDNVEPLSDTAFCGVLSVSTLFAETLGTLLLTKQIFLLSSDVSDWTF